MKFVYIPFSEVNLKDVFFDSLKEDYSEFSDWFLKKAAQGDQAYVFYNDQNAIDGFLYLKEEHDNLPDVKPPTGAKPFKKMPRLKVGTLKINAHGTRLGERFVKKIFDHAIFHKYEVAYVTVFDKHGGLINILENHGFEEHGTKESPNGVEKVLFKRFNHKHDTAIKNYPKFSLENQKYWLLAIYPSFHSNLFPDSLLKTESASILEDVSHTNSIHKIYLSAATEANNFKSGDILIIYRTAEEGKAAEYNAVASSVCVIEEIKHINSFNSQDAFMKYCLSYSIFTEQELITFWNQKKYPYIIKFLYNFALTKRVTRHDLIESAGLDRSIRWTAFELTRNELNKIFGLGKINESLIIN